MDSNSAVLPGVTTKNKKNKTAKKGFSIFNRQLALKAGILVLIILVFVGTFAGYAKAYDGKIYPKVVVAGVKIGGMTLDEAKKAVQKTAQELNEKGPEITYNGNTLTPKLDEMGVSFNVDEAVNAAYQFGRGGNLFSKLKENWLILVHHHQIEIVPQIDEQKFNDFLTQLAQVAEKEPINAGLSIRDGVIYLNPSEGGRGLDKFKLKNDLKNFINSGQNGRVVMAISDLEPQVKEDGTIEARAQAEKYLGTERINVTYEGNIWTADRTEVGTWIKFNVSGNKLVASVEPKDFVEKIAKQIEIPAKDREIEDGTGTVLNEGQDGRGVDTNTLTNQLKEAVVGAQNNAIFALITFVVPHGQKTIYPHAQPGRFPGRYIDINLSEQTLYAFDGAVQVNSFLVSTGRRGYATPTGEFHIYGKDRRARMHGPDYYLPNVPYISWFSGDYSIHGTYWHHNFGHVMSHGCVNASIADAGWIYDWASVGTPIYIHY